MKEIINKFIGEIENGKSGAFFRDEYVKIIYELKKKFNTKDEIEKAFCNYLKEIFTSENSKAEFQKSIIRLIAKNRGDDTLKVFAKKVNQETNFSRDESRWNRYINDGVSIKLGAKIIFHLLIFEQPNLLSKKNDRKIKSTLPPNNNNVEQTKTKDDKKKFLIASLLIFTIIIIYSNINSTKVAENAFIDKRFYNSNLEDLENDGWFLFNDSIDLNLWDNPKYKNSDYLTLETHLGGSYLDNKDYEPLTINILAHKIDCGDCCEILVKLVNFNPYQRYQQAGFFLFYNDSTIPSNTFTFVGSGDSFYSCIQGVFRDGKYSNEHQLKADKRTLISKIENGKPNILLDSIVFKLVIENNEYSYLYRTDTNDYIPVRTKKHDLPTPKYIGLMALQGRPEIPFPSYPIADIIPAHFEYVEIKNCD